MQDFERLQQSEEPKKPEENKILFQVQQQQQQQQQSTSKLILIPQPNGQYLAVPASQIQTGTQAGTAKLPPRASSAPPTQEQVWQQTHPARPASVDAMGILRSNNSSQRPSPVATPSTPPVAAATPPMPTLEPNESLSIRASIDSDAETPQLTEEVTQPSVTQPQNGVQNGVDENEKPEVKVKILPPTPTPPIGAGTKKVMLKSYGVPLLPKPPTGMGSERANSTMACNVKALVVCKQCGKFCHNDCISSSNVCVSCLIR